VGDDIKVGRLAGNAMAQAMYPYTFGIISDYRGMEGRGLGTGVGLVWRGNFLIATAKHVISDTPAQRIYYLLPQDSLQTPDSQASADWSKVRYGLRHVLESPQILYCDADLAAILLPEQPNLTARNHFYNLDESPCGPPVNTAVGYLGYPAAAAHPVGSNYAAMPSHGFGKVCLANCEYDLPTEFAVEYVPGDELDPHGFSGSGVWYSLSAGVVWSPEVCLAGLVTNYYRTTQVLICARVETLARFLSANL